ncbi:MAG: hypothetical protein ACRC6M_19780 [Microcystaceae cyanobacterium]
MVKDDPWGDRQLQRLQLCLYCLPVVGIVPALWVMRKSPNSSTKKIARLSVKLTGFWLLFYALFWLGGLQSSELLSLRLFYLNTLLTSGYFLTCLVLCWQIFRGKLPR